MDFTDIHNTPSFMQENEARRARWAPLTGGSKEDGHKMYEHGIEKELRDKTPDPSHIRRSTEIALENTLGMLAISKGFNKKLLGMNLDQITEAIDSSAIAPFQKFSLGIVRRAVPKLIMESLVSIQQMAGPTAQLFYLDHTYGDAKAPTAAGDRIDLIASRNETYAGGRFFDAVGLGTGAQVIFNAAHAGTQVHQVFLDGVQQTPIGITIAAGAGPGGVDQFTFGAAPGAGVKVVVSYVGYVECDTPRDLDLELTSKTVTAEDIALRAGFTVQTMQDAMTQHALDVGSEMARAIAGELFAEVDALILLELFTFASAGNVNFNTTGYLPGDTSTADRKAYDATLYDAINNAANLIWQLKHVMPNWIVGGTDAIQRLENLDQYNLFRPSSEEASNVSEIRHRVPMGMLGGMQYTVYKDARMPSDKLLLGYRGASPFHTGYIYAPYIPLWDTGLLQDPSANFKMKRGMMHRAGRCRVDMNNYATVTLT